MKIATILFTYNRPWHTQKVIEGLANNSILPEKLIIFHDGLKEGHDEEAWKSVSKLIRRVSFCPVEIVEAKTNKGLAKSVVDGVNYALKDNDAVIVLEDDCVPMQGYISFMHQCFEKYKDYEQVYSISGYSWPINLSNEEADIYFCGRVCSYGWGTWKNRWAKYEKNLNLLPLMRDDRDWSKYLDLWGKDLDSMFWDNVNGKNDSWAVYWTLNVIVNKGVCINPYISLIQNIGMDGTGVHCTKTEQFDVPLNKNAVGKLRFPLKIECLYQTKEAFTSFHGSSIALYEDSKNKKNALVYGLGRYLKQNENKLVEEYNIIGFVDREKKGWYAGKKIVSPQEIENFEYDVLIIMLYDIEVCKDIALTLVQNYDVLHEKIAIGKELYENNRYQL